MDFNNIIISLLSAIVGTFLGAYLLHYFQMNKYRNLQKVVVKALDILSNYKTFNEAENEFNAKLSVPEKRAVVVALLKLGIPFDFLSIPTFNVRRIIFLDQPVLKEELEQMKKQVINGNCDSLFHQDVDACILSNKKISSVRNSAVKYVELVMKKSRYENGQMIPPCPINQVLTFGELTTNAVFRMRIDYAGSYDNLGNPIEEKLNTLIRDVEFGYYDTLLFWDFESYMNMQNQNNIANVVYNAVCNPAGLSINQKR